MPAMQHADRNGDKKSVEKKATVMVAFVMRVRGLGHRKFICRRKAGGGGGVAERGMSCPRDVLVISPRGDTIDCILINSIT